MKLSIFLTEITKFSTAIHCSGIPSSCDRLLAATFAKKAVDLIADEKNSQLVVWQKGKVRIQPLDTNGFLVQTARSL